MSKLLKRADYISADKTHQHNADSIVQKTTRTTINRSNRHPIKKLANKTEARTTDRLAAEIAAPVKLALHQKKTEAIDPYKNNDAFSEEDTWPVEVYYSYISG